MRTDSYTLFQQARLEMKAAAAWHEEELSAQRLITALHARRDTAYLEALAMGVPSHIADSVATQVTREASRVHEEGLYAKSRADHHRSRGETLFIQCEKTRIKENRRFAKGK